MQILTYPLGILVGSLTIAVDLGTTAPPAELRLDGRTVCALAEKRSTCTVDLGAAPHPHLLEAVKLDAESRVVERVTRGVNVPGEASAEARFFPECSSEKKTCDVKFGWLHPDRKPIVSAHLSLDGVERPIPPDGRLQVPFDPVRGRMLSIELDFGNDDRIVHSDVIGPTRRGEASVALRAVPVVTDVEPAELEKRLRARGAAIQAVERGQAEALFVVELRAVGALDSMSGKRTDFLSQRLSTAEVVTVVPADNPEGMAFPRYAARTAIAAPTLDRSRDITAGRAPGVSSRSSSAVSSTVTQRENTDWLVSMLTLLRGHGRSSPRATDAVAAAGFALGAAPRRRVLILVLADGEDGSRLAPDAVRAYLAEIGVPLVVWRTGAARPAWPDAVAVTTAGELARSLSDARTLLARQVVVWAPPEVKVGDLKD